jgi:DNA-binding XRE family transcriptional regulator
MCYSIEQVNFFCGLPDSVNAKRAPGTPNASVADEPPHELSLALAHNLVAARKEIGMSQRELAAQSGVSRDYLIRIERGTTNVGLGILMILARVVGKAASDLIQLPQLPPPKKK